jgi:hypothetical protein
MVRWCVGTAAHDNAGAPDCRVAKVPCSRSDEGREAAQLELVTVTFAEHEGKTKLIPRQCVRESVEEREGTLLGWIEMLDRLGDDLAAVRPGRVSS